MDSPIDFPKITIGAQTYTLKWGLLAQYLMSKAKVDLRTMIPKIVQAEPEAVAITAQLFSAMVAWQFVELGQTAPSPEYWMLQLEPIWPQVCRAVGETLKKVLLSSQTMKLRETAAPAVELPPE